MANKKIQDHLIISNHFIPIFLFKEFRNSVRFSITKKGMVIRCPYLTNSSKILEQGKSWCEKTFKSKPGAFSEFIWTDYTINDTIQLYGNNYKISIELADTIKDTISWEELKINVLINRDYSKIQQSKAIKYLLSKFAGRRFLHEITQRVHALNEKHFNVTIEKVRLKNNRSNWGSCSNKGNINLSIRLLRAPLAVLDYVIIHELAHRLEMNHSPRFWNLVAKACPDYKSKEKWLKENSHLCTL